MKRRLQSVGLVSFGLTIFTLGIIWAWNEHKIDLPAVAVRGAGRVAGILSTGKGGKVQLEVKQHYQEHSLSCEMAALKMALDYQGVVLPESQLIADLKFDPTPKGGGVWGNPNKGFVGNIDGKMLVDGYGVYWDPVKEVAEKYRRAEIIRNSTASEVAKNIAAGRPVVIWGYYGRYQPFNWTGGDGAPVLAVNGEHVRTVSGFNGPVNAPTSFVILDPIYGKLVWDTEKFMENWTSLGRHGVVIYPHPRWVRAHGDTKIWEISKDGKTRHWIRTLEAFERFGGNHTKVTNIDKNSLLSYKRGDDIR